jgi:hypothetical protein
MPVKLKSSQVQQNFGLVMDRVLLEDDIIVERYGMPRVAIVEYGRYQRLVEAEQKLLRTRLQQASAAASARAAHLTEEEVDDLIERARSDAHSEQGESYDFDYRKARPNRFASQLEEGGRDVILDPDIAEVFTASESVNSVLRALITSMPKTSSV